MKKLLLLAALPLLLVGCADIQESQQAKPVEFAWKEVKTGEFIEVYYDRNSIRYSGGEGIDLKYKVVAYQTVAEVYVETKWANGYEENAYYVGTNLTVYHYEV